MKRARLAAGIVASVLMTWAGTASADEPAARVESVEDQVTVIHAGASVAAIDGLDLFAGDVIKTGPQGSVRIVYPDESALLLGESGELQLEAPVEDAPSVELASGNLHANIQKKLNTDFPRHKFFIHTNDVAMGVRGTEFFVDRGAETSVHTLDGTVDVAGDRDELRAGKGARVGRGQFITGRARRLGAAAKFRILKFLAEHRARHPRFWKIRMRARRLFRKVGRRHRRGSND